MIVVTMVISIRNVGSAGQTKHQSTEQKRIIISTDLPKGSFTATPSQRETLFCSWCSFLLFVPPKIGMQKVGYGMVVDGFAEFQGLKSLRDSPSNQQSKGLYWKCQALKCKFLTLRCKFQGVKFGHSIHHQSMPHPLPAERKGNALFLSIQRHHN